MRFLKFNLLSWWAAGAGSGVASYVSNNSQRGQDGLPFITGRAVKGLVREALAQAVTFGQIEEADLDTLCGAAGKDTDDIRRGRFGSEPGRLRFGNAELPQSWRDWAKAHPNDPRLEQFFHILHATAIDEHHQAKDGSLRAVEVVAPLPLFAPVEPLAQAPADWAAALRTALPLIRSLGMHRNRGLGRVEVTLVDRAEIEHG